MRTFWTVRSHDRSLKALSSSSIHLFSMNKFNVLQCTWNSFLIYCFCLFLPPRFFPSIFFRAIWSKEIKQHPCLLLVSFSIFWAKKGHSRRPFLRCQASLIETNARCLLFLPDPIPPLSELKSNWASWSHWRTHLLQPPSQSAMACWDWTIYTLPWMSFSKWHPPNSYYRDTRTGNGWTNWSMDSWSF